ncbi:MAG: RHS repeat-associated core domain-containing protein [Pyrinomonadaceae bacterium]|nr:RHS repeat-associated core domain-containing protein [Pyrinomonadaceae bacterium]
MKKISATEITVFVYNASGQLVADYSTNVEPAQTARVSYLTSDHLGSPRIITDQLGQTVSKRDFMPYGEEIQRPDQGADTVRQKFTTYERDSETDLDFAQSRMYASKLGRFTCVDPIYITPERVVDPQRINLFIYSRNNPLKFVDPMGEDIVLKEGMTQKQLDDLVEAFYAAYKTEQGKTFFENEAAANTTLTLEVGDVGNPNDPEYGNTRVEGNGDITITLDLEKRSRQKKEGGVIINPERGSIMGGNRTKSIKQPESLENTGKHEVAHGIDSRTDPKEYSKAAEADKTFKGKSKDKPSEKRRETIQREMKKREIDNKKEDLKDFKKLIGADKYKVKS